MATGSEKFRQNEIKRKLLLLTRNEWYFYEPLNTNVRSLKADYFEGSKECYIEFTWGFGTSEQTKRIEFPATELESKLTDFKPKKELSLKFIPQQEIKKEPMEPTTTNSKRTIHDLRNHLFDTIEKVISGKIETNQAASIAQLAQTIINSAKIELEYKKALKDTPTVTLLD
jgi:hypothetical protein